MIYGILVLKFHPQQSSVRLEAGRLNGGAGFPGRIVQQESLAPGQVAACKKQQCGQILLTALRRDGNPQPVVIVSHGLPT